MAYYNTDVLFFTKYPCRGDKRGLMNPQINLKFTYIHTCRNISLPPPLLEARSHVLYVRWWLHIVPLRRSPTNLVMLVECAASGDTVLAHIERQTFHSANKPDNPSTTSTQLKELPLLSICLPTRSSLSFCIAPIWQIFLQSSEAVF